MIARWVVLIVLFAAAPVFTQDQPQRPQPGQPAPPAPPGQPAAPSVAIAPPPPPPREGQPVNIKVELTITDQHAGAAPAGCSPRSAPLTGSDA